MMQNGWFKWEWMILKWMIQNGWQYFRGGSTNTAIVTMYCLVLLHMANLNEGIVNNLKRCQSKGVLAKMQFSSNVSTKSESSKAHSIPANYNRWLGEHKTPIPEVLFIRNLQENVNFLAILISYGFCVGRSLGRKVGVINELRFGFT